MITFKVNYNSPYVTLTSVFSTLWLTYNPKNYTEPKWIGNDYRFNEM